MCIRDSRTESRMPVEQIKSAAAQHEDHVLRTYAMRTRHNVIKASLVAGLLLAIVGVSVWADAGAAETAPATPSLKKAFETRAQVSSGVALPAGVPEDEFNRGTPRTSVIGFI